MKGLSTLQRQILTQSLTPSLKARMCFCAREELLEGSAQADPNQKADWCRLADQMDFTSEDAWPDQRPSASERVALSRALLRLEQRGLLCRHRSYVRRIGFKLTYYGRIVAENLSASPTRP
jgi:hypothetical protein